MRSLPLPAPTLGRSLRLGVLAAVLVLATAVLTVAANGHPLAALLPALATVAVLAASRLPLRATAGLVLFLALLAHNPGGRPMSGEWEGPLYHLGSVLYDNLRLVTGIGFLRFNLLEVMLAGLLVIASLRVLGPADKDGTKRLKAAFPLKVALLVSFLTLVVLVVYGIARGGNFRQLLWQARQLGWLPIIAGLFIAAFRDPRAYRMLGLVVVAVSVLRSLEGLYFYLAIMRPRGLELPYILTHEDSVLFTVALTILGLVLLERPTRGAVAMAVIAMPPILWALLMNNRRLAYVNLLFSAVVLLVLARPAIKRTLGRIALVAAPLLVLYVGAGWSSEARIFAPIASLRSVGDEANASNLTREIENRNLVYTTLERPLAGSGFGHAYDEVEVGPSVERFMENYRYIAHNSVLWLWSLGGLLGFTLLWLPLTVAMFLAPRCYRASPDPVERVAVLASISAAVAYVSQAWGDMGATGWVATLLLAAGLAVIATVSARWGVHVAQQRR